VARVRELETIRAFLTGQGLFSAIDLLFTSLLIAMLFAYSWFMALDLHHLCTTWPAIPSHSPPPRLRHSPGTQNRPVRVPFPGVDGEARCGEPQRFYGLARGGIGDAVVRAKLDDLPRSTSTSQNANGTCSVQADGAWRSGIQNIERRKMGASTSCSVSPLSVSQRPDACMFKSQLPWFSRTVHVAI
jgi:hypothetical protein